MAYTSYFGIVVLFIASIGILNLLMMAAFERTREMGVLAALGMTSRQNTALFMLEGAFIGLLGRRHLDDRERPRRRLNGSA